MKKSMLREMIKEELLKEDSSVSIPFYVTLLKKEVSKLNPYSVTKWEMLGIRNILYKLIQIKEMQEKEESLRKNKTR